MTKRRVPRVAASLAVALVSLAGCGDDGPEGAATSTSPSDGGATAECAAAVESIVSATQRYVRGYEAGRAVAASTATDEDPLETTTTAGRAADDTITESELQAALEAADAVLRRLQCHRGRVQADLTTGLGRVRPEGPVADAVLRQLTASMTGRVAPAARTVPVAVGDDLRDVLATSPDGSTLELAAGEHRIDAPLVLLTGVVIRGAGRDATTIVSTAPEAAVLVLTDRRVELVGVTVRREGEAPGSAVLGGPAASIAVTGARLTGGRADADGEGGAGILMFATAQEAAGRGTTLEVTDTELLGNEAAGIVLTGGHRSSIVGARFEANGQCGICFLGAADGSVEDSHFEGNGVGVAATGTARPGLLRLVIDGGEVGLQVSDEAAPAVDGATITGSSRAAVIYTGTASGSLDDVSCTDVPFGIVVGPDAHPKVGTTDCAFARSS